MTEFDLFWDYFHSIFLSISNWHVPVKRFRVSGDNPWFSESLSELIHLRNKYWEQARFTNSSADWTKCRTIRNKCTLMIRKAKSEFYLKSVTEEPNLT